MLRHRAQVVALQSLPVAQVRCGPHMSFQLLGSGVSSVQERFMLPASELLPSTLIGSNNVQVAWWSCVHAWTCFCAFSSQYRFEPSFGVGKRLGVSRGQKFCWLHRVASGNFSWELVHLNLESSQLQISFQCCGIAFEVLKPTSTWLGLGLAPSAVVVKRRLGTSNL